MDSDEREIFHYLQTWGNDFVSAMEICRRASTKKRFHQNPDWAKPILQRMAERGILEGDALGRYRIKPAPKRGHGGRWISPDIEKILKENGVQVESNSEEAAPDDHYEQL